MFTYYLNEFRILYSSRQKKNISIIGKKYIFACGYITSGRKEHPKILLAKLKYTNYFVVLFLCLSKYVINVDVVLFIFRSLIIPFT